MIVFGLSVVPVVGIWMHFSRIAPGLRGQIARIHINQARHAGSRVHRNAKPQCRLIVQRHGRTGSGVNPGAARAERRPRARALHISEGWVLYDGGNQSVKVPGPL